MFPLEPKMPSLHSLLLRADINESTESASSLSYSSHKQQWPLSLILPFPSALSLSLSLYVRVTGIFAPVAIWCRSVRVSDSIDSAI